MGICQGIFRDNDASDGSNIDLELLISQVDKLDTKPSVFRIEADSTSSKKVGQSLE